MTLVEFIKPLRKARRADKILAAMYWEAKERSACCFMVPNIRDLLVTARVTDAKNWNISDVLRKANELVDRCQTSGGRAGWALTNSGRQHVEDILGLSTVLGKTVSNVRVVLKGLQDNQILRFVEEGIRCLETEANRAAVVFLWSGAVQSLRSACLCAGRSAVSRELSRHNKNVRPIKRIEDFAYVKDVDLLKAAMGLGLLDKSQKDALDGCLKLRNSCGHPGSYWPKEQRVKAFIEDLLGIVWL